LSAGRRSILHWPRACCGELSACRCDYRHCQTCWSTGACE
jgi:hypothetical protein